jgi:anti-anti-sigma regulatory factor
MKVASENEVFFLRRIKNLFKNHYPHLSKSSMTVSYLHPVGIMDAGVGSSLLAQIQSGLDPSVKVFHLDCSSISSINEQGLEYLLQARKIISNAQARLLIFSVNASVLSFLIAKRVDRILELHL